VEKEEWKRRLQLYGSGSLEQRTESAWTQQKSSSEAMSESAASSPLRQASSSTTLKPPQQRSNEELDESRKLEIELLMREAALRQREDELQRRMDDLRAEALAPAGPPPVLSPGTDPPDVIAEAATTAGSDALWADVLAKKARAFEVDNLSEEVMRVRLLEIGYEARNGEALSKVTAYVTWYCNRGLAKYRQFTCGDFEAICRECMGYNLLQKARSTSSATVVNDCSEVEPSHETADGTFIASTERGLADIEQQARDSLTTASRPAAWKVQLAVHRAHAQKLEVDVEDTAAVSNLGTHADGA